MNAESTLPLEITVEEVKRKIDQGQKLTLLDVREPEEVRLSFIDGSITVPMGTVPANLPQIETMADETHVVVYCHHGARSLQVVDWLRRQGVADCQSMAGGIDAWSLTVDSAVPRY